ncbi:MAG: GMC family oxidoreductase [Acidimicrobiia bacterium]
MTPVRDAIVIGSGFGGTMVAHELVRAGLDVLMLERGNWVPRGLHNWEPSGTVDLTPFYSQESPYRVTHGGNGAVMGAYNCVGGPSVFFGGVTMRFREADFAADPDIVGDSGAAWPYDYEELEPWYTQAERIMGVAGEPGDPTDPRRSGPFPHKLNGLSDVSRRIADASRDLGLSPFRLPLAINYAADNGRLGCRGCTTCDTFACAIGAKNDLATHVLPGLVDRGLELRPNMVVTRLVEQNGRVQEVECHDKATGQSERLRATVFFVSAGALGTPHLLLSSGIERANPAGNLVGRNLMRHCNAITFGVFPGRANARGEFHKQIGIHDFYFGHAKVDAPLGKLGSIQQLHTPPDGLVRSELPAVLGPFVRPAVEHLTGLISMAEDQPRESNHVRVDWNRRDGFGLPQLTIEHHYTARDIRARNALVRQCKQIFRRAGAPVSYVHQIKTFSHAVGTVRFGDDPTTSVLDPFCRFRGVDNLHVVDASFMPTSAGLNPSLTISANALRVGAAVARG